MVCSETHWNLGSCRTTTYLCPTVSGYHSMFDFLIKIGFTGILSHIYALNDWIWWSLGEGIFEILRMPA